MSDILDRESDFAQDFPVKGLLKAHDSAINTIKTFECDGRVSLITTSDDMMVKIFSLQTKMKGPLRVELLGVLNILKPECAFKFKWNFHYDN